MSAFSPQAVRDDFPILRREINGRPLAYLDNAATTQKPWPHGEALARLPGPRRCGMGPGDGFQRPYVRGVLLCWK